MRTHPKTTLRFATLAALALGAIGLAGCDTFAHRARQRSATFESLTPQDQQRLQRGAINPGDNQDMVYIALGQPDERRDVLTADGNQSVWVYRTYWQQYEGTAWLGYRRVIVPSGRGYIVYHEPVTQDIYRTHADERTRVTFDRNGVVQTVEQSDRR